MNGHKSAAALIVGKEYPVLWVHSNMLSVSSEVNHHHYFLLDEGDGGNYKKYFHLKPSENPIIMQPDMALATHQEVKDVTRRTRGLEEINKNPDGWEWQWEDYANGIVFFEKQIQGGRWESVKITSPYGQPGDLLWIRENFKLVGWDLEGGWCIQYGATPEHKHSLWIKGGLFPDDPDKEADVLLKLHDLLDNKGCDKSVNGDYMNIGNFVPWRPSIHMPKAAARMWAEVVSTRPERLHSITGDDCLREGLNPRCGYSIDLGTGVSRFIPDGFFSKENAHLTDECRRDTLLRAHYFHLFWGINKKKKGHPEPVEGRPALNPWVWRIEYKLVSKTGKP